MKCTDYKNITVGAQTIGYRLIILTLLAVRIFKLIFLSSGGLLRVVTKIMIAIKSIRLMHLLSYVLVTSQVLFYLFILCKALKAVSLENYFELRKVIDSLMIKRFKFMYYSCLALSIVAVVVSAKQPASLFFISSATALIFLSIDLAITVRGSLPLNALSHSYGSRSENVNWENVRTQWLDYMKYRGIVIVLGMAGLLAGLVFEKN